MASSPSPAAEPVLLKQYKLLGAVIDAPWATSLDHKITRHVIERYYAKFGNARVSLRYLERATGSERNKIIPSLRRIIENGVISIIRQGIGTRPTEYDLNFDFTSKIPSGALEGTSTSGALEGTSSGALEGTSTASSGALQGTQTYLRNMSTDMLTVGMNEDTPAVPTAPPVTDAGRRCRKSRYRPPQRCPGRRAASRTSLQTSVSKPTARIPVLPVYPERPKAALSVTAPTTRIAL
jgi:hypothetical protein